MLFWLQLLHPSRCYIKRFKRSFRRENRKKNPTEELVQMAEFVLKNNFDFNGQIKQKISGAAIGTKCAPTYACIYRGIRWKENFWRKKNINVSHGFDISIVFSLFELLVMINLKHSWKILIISILI